MVESNLDHSDIASKSGKAPPKPPVRMIKPFALNEVSEIAATTVPTATPLKV
jgi:hypothetical protein